jgi:CRP-like cAMP-binding protein
MIEALTRLPLLANLEEDVLQQIAAQSEELTFSQGQVIALEGEPCPSVLLVGRGIVQLRQLSQEGREHVLAYLSEGSCIHLAAALDGGTNLSTVESLTPVVLYAIKAERFLEIMKQHPGLAMVVAQCLADEVKRLTAMVKDLALHSVRTRLARFLLVHAESAWHAGGQPAQQTWTQEAIAARIGTVRDVVGRMLRAFADEGLLRRQRGRLVILDRAGLEREAQSEELD